jgi:Protein of Unknown function (DUF2604)
LTFFGAYFTFALERESGQPAIARTVRPIDHEVLQAKPEELMSTQVVAALASQKFEVQVVYNGLTKPLEVEPNQQMIAVVERAAHLFGITQNVHTLALFKEDGSEIAIEQSVAAAGIKVGELLALRPSVVRGG